MKRQRLGPFVVVALSLLGAACAGSCRHPDKYVMPNGYVGWVKIYYSVPAAPPLPIEQLHRVFNIPESGVFVTSSAVELGWAADSYYYQRDGELLALRDTGWGEGGVIWAGYNGSGQPGGPSGDYAGFFVGTERQYRELKSNPDEPGRLVH